MYWYTSLKIKKILSYCLTSMSTYWMQIQVNTWQKEQPRERIKIEKSDECCSKLVMLTDVTSGGGLTGSKETILQKWRPLTITRLHTTAQKQDICTNNHHQQQQQQQQERRSKSKLRRRQPVWLHHSQHQRWRGGLQSEMNGLATHVEPITRFQCQ